MGEQLVRTLVWCVTIMVGVTMARAAEPKSLLDGDDIQQRVKPSSEQVSSQVGADGLSVTIEPGGEGYPGVTLSPADGQTWDLSHYGHLAARITNTGDKAISLTLRVDDDGPWQSNPWNAEQTYLKPGATGEIKLIFGYSWGRKPGYKLKADKISRILIFSGAPKAKVSFVVNTLLADGPAGEKPPVDPASIRIVPEQGLILGGDAQLDAGKQLKATSAKAAVESGAVTVQFENKPDALVKVSPVQGRWDLRSMLQVRVTMENIGNSPMTPRVRVDSNKGNTPWHKSEQALAPGQTLELVVPFIGEPWNGQAPGESGTRLGSDAVSGIVVAPSGGQGASALRITKIIADMPVAPRLPDWLGKRPPVDGEWTLTLEDNFEGGAVNDAVWNIYGENYWDKQSHFSKDNVIVGDGVVRLRFSKQRGHQNDDPSHQRVTDHATGYLDTYGKWVQRYGYFEARMKLPTAPGLWPAFWMMPDRVDAGPQWKRQDTARDGMEFDIMEHLTRWGPYRYNMAIHWDGYGKEHKSTGTETLYFQPDADGFMTAGLLWTPGELVWYCNGREVARYTGDRVASAPGCLIFTLPMGGWDNSPLDDATLPDDFVIDYVRCWQRADLKSSVDGKVVPPNTNRH